MAPGWNLTTVGPEPLGGDGARPAARGRAGSPRRPLPGLTAHLRHRPSPPPASPTPASQAAPTENRGRAARSHTGKDGGELRSTSARRVGILPEWEFRFPGPGCRWSPRRTLKTGAKDRVKFLQDLWARTASPKTNPERS